MRKSTFFKSLLMAAGLFLGTNVWATGEWSIDFAGIGANYADMTGVTISSSVAKIGGTDMGTCTVGGEALNENFVLQTGTTWTLRTTSGLYQYNSGGRAMGMLGCTAGQIITIVGTGNPNPSTNATLKNRDGNTYVYTVTADGNVKFTPARYLYFTSISVANPSATAVEYTVKYVDEEGNEIKEATKGSGEAGATITLTSSEKDSFKNDGGTKKYIYTSDDSEGKTIAEDGSTVVTITFREAATYTYNVTNNLGDEIASGSAFEEDDVYFYVSYFVFKEGKFYQSPSLSSGTLSYGQGKISAIAENTEITVTYTEEKNTTVVFFSEAENLEGVTPYEDTNVNGRMSNGKVGYFGAQTAIFNLPAGNYTITSSSRYGTTTFTAGETDVYTLNSTGSVVTDTSDVFTLEAATDIKVSAGDKQNYFDYVIIRQLPATVTATVGATGWATFASDYALTVEEADGAYAITGDENGYVTLAPITGDVEAGTPMLLKDEGEKTFDVVASGDPVASNLLARGDGEAVNSGYVLVARNGVAVFAAIGDDKPVVATNKAYLKIAAGAPVLFIEGMATGISAVENAKVADGQIYNLAGQRVAKAQKGLYIVNGKKFIVK